MTRYLEKKLPVAPPEPIEALEGNDSLMEDAPPSPVPPGTDDEPLPPGVDDTFASEYGTCKTVKAKLWPLLSDKPFQVVASPL